MMRHRKSCRLQGYDYSQQGVYFITICTWHREHLFGEVIDGMMVLNEWGHIVDVEARNIEKHYKNIICDTFVIMPNHIHLLIAINPEERINPFPTGVDIPNIIGKFKAGITRNVGNAFMRSHKTVIWQKGYHDHIVRNQDDYNRIYEYIQNNPLQWELDCHNPLSEKYKDWSEST